jgi:hypothetical protein
LVDLASVQGDLFRRRRPVRHQGGVALPFCQDGEMPLQLQHGQSFVGLGIVASTFARPDFAITTMYQKFALLSVRYRSHRNKRRLIFGAWT